MSIIALHVAMVRNTVREDLILDLDQMQALVAFKTHPSSTYATVNNGVSSLVAAKAGSGTRTMMADGVLQQLSISDIVGAVDDRISLFTVGTVISFFGGLI